MDSEIRETVYEHEHGRDTFTITAAERWSINMVRKLKEKRPDEVQIVAENPDGTLLARMPYSWMRVCPKRKVNISDEERDALIKRLNLARAKSQEGARPDEMGL